MVPDQQGLTAHEIKSFWGTFNNLGFYGLTTLAGQGPHNLEPDGPFEENKMSKVWRVHV